jgi:hypothetical protein
LSSEIVRSLRVGELVDESRENLSLLAEWYAGLPEGQQRSAARRSRLVTKGRGRPHDRDQAHYERVAALYREATAKGVRGPAKFVTERLAEQGEMFTSADESARRAQTRKWLAESRRRGLLPPTERGGK